MAMADRRHRVVIVGGGFGGLFAAKRLKNAPVDITLIDRRNFHLFQPLLYQVATGGLSPANIASPLRGILKRQKNARVLLGEVVDFDVQSRKVILADSEVEYDSLIVAAGARHHYFGQNEWESHAPGLKTIEDATAIRGKILNAFENAERESDPQKRKAWLTFVVVGAGPTGVELSGALAEISRDTLKHDFRNFNPADAEVILVEGLDRVLANYPEELSLKAKRALEKLGVKVKLGARVTHIDGDEVLLDAGGNEERIKTHSVLWAAGVQASPLGKILSEQTGTELDRAGRLLVNADMTLNNHPEIFCIGDMALYKPDGEDALPGVCQVAMQEGSFVADIIQSRLTSNKHRVSSAFTYVNKGDMATIGRAAAVANLGKLKFSGWTAWLMWLFIHVFYLIEFENRILVMTQWAWNYIFRNRSARLITGVGESSIQPDSNK